LPADSSVGESIMFLGCVPPVRLSVHAFVRSSGQMLLSWCLMNGLNELIKLTGNIHCPLLLTSLDSGGQGHSRPTSVVTKA